MKMARPQRRGRLPGIIPSKFSSILGLYHHGVTRGHHGQWNNQRKCAVRLWNHAWDVEDVWSSSWTAEIVETDTRRTYTHCSKTDTSYGTYSYVMHILLSTIQDLLLRTKYVCTWRGLSVGTRHSTTCLLLSLVPSSKVVPPRLSIGLLLYAMILVEEFEVPTTTSLLMMAPNLPSTQLTRME
jgi:hypothetical protein